MSSQPLITMSPVTSMSPATSILSILVSPPASTSSSLPFHFFVLCFSLTFLLLCSLVFLVLNDYHYILFCTLESHSHVNTKVIKWAKSFQNFQTYLQLQAPTCPSFNFCTLIFISFVFSLLHLVSTCKYCEFGLQKEWCFTCLRLFGWVRALFTRLASKKFNKFFFKIGFHSTIHTFKNYFVTLFSVFSNKRYPNRTLVLLLNYNSSKKKNLYNNHNY